MPLPTASLTRHVLPLADGIGTAGRRILGLGSVLLVTSIAFAIAHTVFGIGGDAVNTAVRDYASSLVYVLGALIVWFRAIRIREARGPWIAFAAGVTLYGAGNLVWDFWLQNLAEPPIPSVADVLWLSLYPLAYAGLVRLGLRGTGKVPAGVWLDGVVVGLGVSAVGAALLFGPVVEAASGSPVAVAINLAYPVADLTLAGLVLAILAIRGWRLDACWALMGGGFLVLCGADFIFLLHIASGAVDQSMVANIFYLLGVAMLSAAAWHRQSPVSTPNVARWSVLLVPAAAVLSALALLVIDHFQRLDPFAFSLAILTFVAGIARTGLTFRDVRALARTRREALTDYLTELPNRRLFGTRLDDAIDEARVLGGTCALLMLDVDRFKELNDTLGHQAGDRLLQQIGPRLRSALRSADTVARLGGDEFALVLRTPIDERGALKVGETALRTMARPFVTEELSVHVAASIGIALFPDHGTDAEELMRRADVAMYRAKTLHSGCELYAPDWDADARYRRTLVTDLGHAIRGGNIRVHFQPIAEAASRRVTGVEALARWSHPEHGSIPPGEFVPIAEEASLARDLTRHVLAQALDQCRRWRDGSIDVSVRVNLTATDLHDASLPQEVAAALAARALPPEALVLEVTENSVLTDPLRIGKVLARLRELGVGLALDDFGTGYSSLTHLKTLPVGEVKIDRSFVADMATDAIDGAIVGSTIDLAHSLGMRVVAEGVEDERTWERLAELGCDLVQGYALSRPVPATELEAVLRDACPLAAGAA
jgi:diguanylate cyclase (GGDEF)-like protein